jgi:hypothetical protein
MKAATVEGRYALPSEKLSALGGRPSAFDDTCPTYRLSPVELPSPTWKDSDVRNRVIPAEEGCAENREVHPVRMNEMLTPALRTTKLNKLGGPAFRNRPHVSAAHTTTPG